MITGDYELIIYQTEETVFYHVSKLNTKKRVENATRGGVFLMDFEVFGNVGKRCLECLKYLLNRNNS